MFHVAQLNTYGFNPIMYNNVRNMIQAGPCYYQCLSRMTDLEQLVQDTIALVCGQNGRTGSCVSCPVGYFTSFNQSRTCTKCAPGKFASSPGSASCDDCPSGTYSDPGNSASCKTCPYGYSSENSRGLECTACPTGFSTPTEKTKSCTVCEAGRYAQQQSSVSCTRCPAGRFAATIEARECVECVPGQYQESIGRTGCNKCDSGYFQSEPSAPYCDRCPRDKFQNSEGASECTACDEGKGSLAGSSSCRSTSCDAGFYALSESHLPQCAECLPGQYSLKGQAISCTLCPKGLYSTSSQASACSKCEAGQHAGSQASQSCASCAPGRFVDREAASTCEICPAGWNGPTSGATSCQTCEKGHFTSGEGGISCDLCAAGRFAATIGSILCEACPENTYSTDEGSVACSRCPKGYSTEGGQAATLCARPVGASERGEAHTELSYSLLIIYIILMVACIGGIIIVHRSWRAAYEPSAQPRQGALPSPAETLEMLVELLKRQSTYGLPGTRGTLASCLLAILYEEHILVSVFGAHNTFSPVLRHDRLLFLLASAGFLLLLTAWIEVSATDEGGVMGLDSNVVSIIAAISTLAYNSVLRMLLEMISSKGGRCAAIAASAISVLLSAMIVLFFAIGAYLSIGIGAHFVPDWLRGLCFSYFLEFATLAFITWMHRFEHTPSCLIYLANVFSSRKSHKDQFLDECGEYFDPQDPPLCITDLAKAVADANPNECNADWQRQFYLVDPKDLQQLQQAQQPLLGSFAPRARAAGSSSFGGAAGGSIDFKDLKGNHFESKEIEGGHLKLTDLPTSSASLAPGVVWNDGGVLKIAPTNNQPAI